MRKNILLLFTIVALSSTAAFSQKDGFGIKFGPNFANVSGDVSGNKMIIYGHFGFYYNAMINDRIAIHPELVASGQGYTAEFGTEDVPFTLAYVNIPILAKYYVTEGLNFEFGPQIGFLVLAAIDNETEFLGTPVKDGLSGTDFSLGMGANYELSSGFNFGLRYNLGLSNVNDGGGGIKNSVIQLSLGMTFGG